MKCLHICNDFLGSRVHGNLYSHLNVLNLEQTIYYPVRAHTIEKIKLYENDSDIEVIGSKPLKKIHKFFFRKKINHLFDDLQTKTDLNDYDIVHATTLLSDGALALRIFEKHGIPYVVALRGTDVNLFLKYRPDLLPLAKEVLINAKKIIFISKSLEHNFFNHFYIKNLNCGLRDKSEIIPNGLDSFWLNNIKKKESLSPFKILYIGRFDKNKNVLNLIKGFLEVKKQYPHLQLDLIGKGGEQEEEIKQISQTYQGIINYHGPIYDKEQLQKMFQSNHVFAMLSLSETFGLVYLEALSQGLPIICTKNQGIDGTFKENVGESVNPKSISSIASGLEKIITNYSLYEPETIDFDNFSWEKISNLYINLYNSCINN